MNDVSKWNKIYSNRPMVSSQACKVLTENLHLLPAQGTALDLACGVGINAMLLAQHGLDVTAWDISRVAIETLSKTIIDSGIHIDTEIRDVVAMPPIHNSYDVIVVSHFLERKIMPNIKNALRSNGILFYQTFLANKTSEVGPKNPDYLLHENELLTLFNDLNVLLYREEGLIDDRSKGFRNEAMLIAKK